MRPCIATHSRRGFQVMKRIPSAEGKRRPWSAPASPALGVIPSSRCLLQVRSQDSKLRHATSAAALAAAVSAPSVTIGAAARRSALDRARTSWLPTKRRHDAATGAGIAPSTGAPWTEVAVGEATAS